MMKTLVLYNLTLAFFFLSGAHSAKITFTNNCLITIWPGTLTSNQKSQLSNTGFELASKASLTLNVQAPWQGRFWPRTQCSTNSGKFTCETADCGTGQVACNGNRAIPPASLVEINIAANGGNDFYDVSLVDGLNLPVSVATRGGTGVCKPASCPANVINALCPADMQVKGSDGSVLACKSACTAFNQPQYCCTGAFNTPQTCPPSDYSRIVKEQCPQAYSYAYDDSSSTFTCSGAPDYVITFCP